MLYFLKGITAALEPGLAVMECAGVGYACKTTSFTLSGLQLGKPATLYTHLSVREDGIELYGFGTKEEKRLFLQLTSVSGVGPKAALSILSTTTLPVGAGHFDRGRQDPDLGSRHRQEDRPAHCPGAAG